MLVTLRDWRVLIKTWTVFLWTVLWNLRQQNICWSFNHKLTLTNKPGVRFMLTRSITVNTDFVVMSNLHGRSMKALSQYRTWPKFPSTDVGRLSLGMWNWNGKLYSPGPSTGFSPDCSGAKRRVCHFKFILKNAFNFLLHSSGIIISS